MPKKKPSITDRSRTVTELHERAQKIRRETAQTMKRLTALLKELADRERKRS